MKLGFIGTGAMSGAIARGLRAAGDAETEFFFVDNHQAAADALAEAVGGRVVGSSSELVGLVDVALLGVKPHVQPAVLAEIAPAIDAGAAPALLSIAAGRSLANITSDLEAAGVQSAPPIVRVMPNVNAQIGQSMSAITATPETPAETLRICQRIFESVGRCIELPESLFAAFAAMAGCSPAWLFQIADSFARAGVKHGLTKDQALVSIAQSMLGSAELLLAGLNEGRNPGALIDQVCSPGGTTVAGLLAAEQAGLADALVEAVDAAVERDRQLGG